MALDRMHCADSHAKIRTSLYVVPGIVWLIVATYDPSKIFFNFADCSLYYVFNVSLMSLFWYLQIYDSCCIYGCQSLLGSCVVWVEDFNIIKGVGLIMVLIGEDFIKHSLDVFTLENFESCILFFGSCEIYL